MHAPHASALPSRARHLADRAGLWLRERGLLQLAALLGLGVAILASRLRGGRHAARERRLADRVARTLGRLRGPFAKLGQFASLRVDVVSPALREALSALRDEVPPLPFHVIRSEVERALAAPLGTLFREVDPSPLGAASIAQVHAARLHDGREVAIKVQYPWLARSLGRELALVRLTVALVAGPRAARAPWLGEFARAVREELDFAREAAAAGAIAANLASERQVVVPAVIASHSRGRVLTMERLPTLRLTELRARGVPVRAVLDTIVRAYARQIFEDGLFHADPHPGNLFVVDEPAATTAPRVLFLDFGLCHRLSPELARELRQGILALLGRDLDAFIAGMRRIGAVAPGAEPGVRAAVASVFDELGGAPGGALALSGTRVLALKDRAKQLLYETPGLVLPNDLLLYAKTLSYLFALAREIAPDVDPMPATVPWLLRFLAKREDAPTRPASAASTPGAG